MPNSWKDVLEGNEDIGRRDTLKVAAGGAAGTALAVDAVDDDDNMYTRIAGALNSVYQGVFVDPVVNEIEERQEQDPSSDSTDNTGGDNGSSNDSTDTKESTDAGGADVLDYGAGDLPYNSIGMALEDQSADAHDAIEDVFAEAYFNRDNSVSTTANDALIDVDNATVEEYLQADSSERNDMDVELEFEGGTEGTKLRGSASAGVNEEFEEYMVGLEYLDGLDEEVEEYVQDLEDSL